MLNVIQRWALLICFCVLLIFCAVAGRLPGAQGETTEKPHSPQAVTFPLPLPSVIGVAPFEKLLDQFLIEGGYKTWVRDHEYRATGPFIDGKSYGVHPAVRIYYSPEMWAWMQTDRKGEIPDTAMIVKEQYPLPLRQDYTDKDRSGFSIMVRDKQGSWDGWYWSSGVGLSKAGTSPFQPPFAYPWAGFGQYCVNCHASADNPFSTYSTKRNVLEEPMTYASIVPTMQPQAFPDDDIHARLHRTGHGTLSLDPNSLPNDEAAFAKLFPQIRPSSIKGPIMLPGESYDSVVQGPQPHGQKLFVTSDQCIGCHDGTMSNDSLPNMIYNYTNTQRNINLSPYGEWRASMMGLAGRDPIFYAQLETERTLYPNQAEQIDDKCLSCHGVMGERQLAHDSGGLQLLTHEAILATPDHDPRMATYGALARDGVSCDVCHHIAAKGLGTPETYTGQFFLGADTEIFGPYKDIVDKPMKQAIGLTPKQTTENQIRSSMLCGSCHTVETPILSEGGTIKNPVRTAHEQSTYLEWKNSIYTTESSPAPSTAKSCQQCHMPSTYAGQKLKYRVANIEDSTFPFTDNRLPDKDITVQVRGTKSDEPYSRHALVGINLFGISIFKKFPDSLGIRTTDPMATYGKPQEGLRTAEEAMLKMATEETAKIEFPSLRRTPQGIEAQVRVTNLTGHKFPSGVGFRRAFLELTVRDSVGKLVWASGRTNSNGVIIDGTSDRPLPTEFFAGPPGHQAYQPYHAVIERGDQVQIYEELVKNKEADGVFTTSFLSLAKEFKDTRLMPKGWSSLGPDAQATRPNGGDGQPVGATYLDGSGSDALLYRIHLGLHASGPLTVHAALYYQSIPPSYLKQRFETAPNGPATRNLYYYTSRLDPNRPGTHIQQWKLKITAKEQKL